MKLPFTSAVSRGAIAIDHHAAPGRANRALTSGLLLGLLAIAAPPSIAQPSGGPYGPVQRTYAVPKDAAHVFFVAPDGSPDARGDTLEQPASLETAIARAVTGDAVILRGGVYRTGGLLLNQGITLQPYADERPILKGTQPATEWRALRDHVWMTSWSHLFPMKPADWWRRHREGMRTPLHRFNNDMVFVDGEMLQSAAWEGALDEHSFFIDYEAGEVFIGVDPTDRLVEITVHDSALVRTTGECHGRPSDRQGPTIRGLTFTQYAYRALEIEGSEPEGKADPSAFGKDVVGTTLEDVAITYCSRVAAYLRGDGLTIRRCLVSDTSTEGLYIIASSDVLLEKNLLRRNNVERITGYYPAAVKIFNQTRRVTCRDNLVIDQPYSNGIWYDVGNVDGVFVDNWVEGAMDGFFFEISKGVVCAGNVFVRCDKGIRILNSSNARVYNNTLVDTVASFERTERSAVGDHFGWHPSTGPDVDERHGHVFVGNLLLASPGFDKPLLRFEQRPVLCGRLTESQATRVDENVYVRAGARGPEALIVWSPVDGEPCQVEVSSLEALRELDAGLEPHGRCLNLDLGSVIKSPELGHYELFQPLPGARAVDFLPDEIRRLLGWKKASSRAPGAYLLRP